MTKHALLSPSSAHRWAHCPGSVVLTKDMPRTSSEFADEGTAAHELAAMCLGTGKNTSDFIDIIIHVDARQFRVDDEMAGHVQKYVDLVRSMNAETMVEQKVNISSITGEKDASGTSDAVLIDGAELIIVDLKYGRGVKVDAENNEQLAIYAAAAVEQFDILGEIDRVRMVISQPRLDHVSEWAQSLEQLRHFINGIKVAAGFVRGALALAEEQAGFINPTNLKPGDKQCKFCDAKATCPALARQVLNTVADDFVDLDATIKTQIDGATDRVTQFDNVKLGECLDAVDLIEGWCKAVRARVESELLAGNTVQGYKLVEGRRGSRKWIDEEEVEATMKAMRIKKEDMYDFSLISPTSAEKLAKSGVIGERQWPKLKEHITQSEGKPSVAPESDKRPAITVQATADDFDNIDDILDLVAQAA